MTIPIPMTIPMTMDLVIILRWVTLMLAMTASTTMMGRRADWLYRILM
jgi:hypothetical protein